MIGTSLRSGTWARGRFAALAAAVAIAMAPMAALAAEPAQGDDWRQLMDSLTRADQAVVGNLPAGLSEQDVADLRIMELGALTSGYLNETMGDPDHPYFVPTIGLLQDFFAPNPDDVYRNTLIDGHGSYLITGTRGTTPIVNLAVEYGPYLGLTGKPTPHVDYDFDSLRLGPHGEFKVLLSAQRPSGYDGDWWYLDPRAQILLLRSVSDDWAGEVDPSLAIERLDHPAHKDRPETEDMRRRLALLAPYMEHSITLFEQRAAKLESEGWVNKAKELPIVEIGGLTSQRYFHAIIEFDKGEGVLLEAPMPHCRYWSLLLTDMVDATLDWYDNPSSLNRTQARVDSDGKLRVVISDTDPGIPNWLDTQGRHKVSMQLRWMGCDNSPTPDLRKIALSDVRKFVPADTPSVSAAERDAMLRQRRQAAQLRRQW
jgi:hypothetical protein